MPVLLDYANNIYDIRVRSIAYIRKNDKGRKKLWDERILLPLASGTLERLDAALQDDETRLDLIRSAIERELKRRERRMS
jgi:hypothetical protein